MATFQSFSSDSERAGLALIAFSGLVSALSTISLLGYIFWNAYLTKDRSSSLHRGIRSFVQSSLGSYLLSLLLCDFLQGTAFSINFKWAAEGNMRVGTACTIQGAVSEVGDLGTAIWSLAISLHTFSLLFLVHKPHRLIAPIVLSVGWTLLIVLPILGPTAIETRTKGPFYGLSGAWCWLSVPYRAERLIYLYIWVFTTLGSSVIIYSLIYLRFSNFIIIDDNGRFQFQWKPKSNLQILDIEETTIQQPTKPRVRGVWFKSIPGWCLGWRARSSSSSTWGKTTSSVAVGPTTNMGTVSVSQDLKQVARRLMWYPIQYAIVVLPVSVCRMGVLAGWTPPFGFFSFAGVCFAGSGITNSILFILTRHSFLKKLPRKITGAGAGVGIRMTTQRIVVRDEEVGSRGKFKFNGGKNVELSPIFAINSTITTATGPSYKSNTLASSFDAREEESDGSVFGRDGEGVTVFP